MKFFETEEKISGIRLYVEYMRYTDNPTANGLMEFILEKCNLKNTYLKMREADGLTEEDPNQWETFKQEVIDELIEDIPKLFHERLEKRSSQKLEQEGQEELNPS